MKTLLLASAAVLALGIGSAFAATNTTGFDKPQQAATNMQTGNNPAGGDAGAAPSGVPAPYAYNGQSSAAPRTQAPAMTLVPPTPLGAIEAYQGDAPGGA